MKQLIGLSVLLAGVLVAGCARPAKPHELFSDVGNARVGGAMRVAQDPKTRRNPPLLPKLLTDDSALAKAGGQGDPSQMDGLGVQPPPPPPPTLSTSAKPNVVVVPNDVDSYYQGGTPVLSSMFDSVFVPPVPPTPTTTSSSSYKVVE